MGTGSAAATHEAQETRRADYDAFIDSRLDKVRSYVKIRDVVSGLALMVAGLVAFLLVVILLDHWIADIGFAGRLFSAVILLGWCVFVLAARVAPAMLRPINPAYAAKVVEESEPSLKQTLLNYVFFRRDRTALKEVVYRTVEREAVSGLSHVEVDSAVDQTPLIRRAIVVAVLVSIMGLYTVLSPKSPLSTVARVLSPWSGIARPARVQIREVRPGHAQIYFGRVLEVSARIDRLADDDRARVEYSTADGRETDVEVELQHDVEARRYLAKLPQQGGVEGDLTYSILAGDAKAGPFRVRVVAAPSMNIERMEFDYPDYTGREDATVENEGDISAPEGTRVTIHATTNEDIASAYVEFDPDLHKAEAGGRRAIVRDTIPMQHDQREASASFTLALKQDRRTPVRQEYRLRFVNDRQESNDEAIHYRIEVIPDLAPRVEILIPQKRDITIPENGQQAVQVRALDPDYELNSLELHLVAGGRELRVEPLLDQPEMGQLVREFVFVPAEFSLHAGDIVMLWATAADNRADPISGSPAPNTERTDRYTIRIGVPAESESGDRDQNRTGAENPNPGQRPGDARQPPRDANDRMEGEGVPGSVTEERAVNRTNTRRAKRDQRDEFDRRPGSESSGDNQTGGNEAGNARSENGGQGSENQSSGENNSDGDAQADPGESRSSERGEGKQRAPVANDGSSDGDAFERILERMKETGATDGQQQSGQQQSGQQQSGQQQSGQQQSGQQQSGQQQSGQQQSGQQQSGQQQSGQQQSGQQQSGQQQSGQQQSGQQQSGQQQSGQQQSGQQQSGQQQSGQQQSGQQQSGQQQSGQQQSGQQQSGQQQSGQQQSGQQQSGQQQSGQQQSGQQQSGQQQSGQQQSGQQQSGQQQSGQQQSGQQQSGQQQSGQQQSGQQQSGQQQSGQQQSGQQQSGQQQSGQQQSGQQQSGQQQSGQQQPSQDTESGSQGNTPKGSSRTRSPGGAQGSANQQGGQQGSQPQPGGGQTGSGGQGAANSQQGGSGSTSTSEEMGGQQQSGSRDGRQGSRRTGTAEGSSPSPSTSSSSNGTGEGSSGTSNQQSSAPSSDGGREGSRQYREERTDGDGSGERGGAGERDGERGTGERGAGERGERTDGERGSDEQGSDEQGSDERGSDEQGSDEQGSDERGSDEQGSDEQGSDEQGSDEQGSGGQGSGGQGSGGQGSGEGGERSDASREGSGQRNGGEQGNQPSGEARREDSERGTDEQGSNSGETAGDGPGQAAANRGDAQGGARGDASGEGGEPGESGDAAQHEMGDQQAGRPGDEAGSPSQVSSSGGQGQQGNSPTQPGGAPGGMPGGGGAPGDAEVSVPPSMEDEPGGDAVNEEFARRATDMALEYLQHQQQDPDKELLDRLGWTPEDLNAFVRRWEQLKRDAAEAGGKGEAAKRELDEALNSLGLTPGRDRVREAGGRNDAAGGVTDAGTRSRPPAEYLERYKAYLKSSRPD